MIIHAEHLNHDLQEIFDVIVVGSGAGGSAAAYELSKAGYMVALVEEGHFHATEDFSVSSVTSVKRMYRDGGLGLVMGKPNTVYAEGRTVGGSTVINGGMTWKTPSKVLKRWRWEAGLTDFTDKALGPVFADVEKMIGSRKVPKKTIGNDNKLLMGACDSLGYQYKHNDRADQNCVGTNLCALGCPTGGKGSTLVTYIPAGLKHGLTVFTGLKATSLIMEGRRAVGVSGQVVDRDRNIKGKFTFNSRVVILACGAIQTPLFLLRNKIRTESDQVGKNLYLHPNAKALGIFEDPVNAWDGVIQAMQVTEFLEENILMATTFMPPSMVSMSLPYMGNQAFQIMKEYASNGIAAGVLVEDTVSGYVKNGPFGLTLAKYNLSPYDFHNALRGLGLLSELYFEAGAKKVLLPLHGLDVLESRDEIARIFQGKFKHTDLELFTVHMMGTCRMGSDPRRAVVSPNGEVFGIRNLFVADASLFPTPIGVNPQETIMTLATFIARRIADSHDRYFLRT